MENGKWYDYLKKKFKLSDDDMEEYIESFDTINKGEKITPNILTSFIITETNQNDWTIEDSQIIIEQINQKVNKKQSRILDLKTYLTYIIPICQNYATNRLHIREIFDMLDKNRDGKITCNDLISILYAIDKNFTPEQLEQYEKHIRNICKKVDTNQDGYLSYKEFKDFMADQIINF